ncbi:PQQ-dependent sugar dehydrogenase [Ktedonospora formicarum]|uniref:Oxidoreductase n=1 Tax=Ktedonospora formicarum TaxID=2778364 RepID=A0A8J3I4J7_9CHLR|nr:PQQ-dependent sugar dehydrogenase [Ktedonospora formicarum]GHO45813.1 oxidoreductase [Ktedonospora formicarum]
MLVGKTINHSSEVGRHRGRRDSRAPWTLLIIAITLLLSACSSSNTTATSSTPTPTTQTTASPTSKATTAPTSVDIKTSVLVKHLAIPWSLAFLPDGRALLAERGGRLLTVDKNGQTQEVQRIPQAGVGEGGLLGIALSPKYQDDKLIYAYYSTATDNRVVRFRLGEQPQVVLQGIPVAGNHDGGRIAFGPDGMLYIGTGDATNRPNSQNKQSLAGKILRITPDGKIPSDNPFSGSAVYSYGHRNVQGLAWDSKGQLYESEFGQNAFDEVNKIMPGKNYGWPEVEGMGNDPRFVNPIVTFATSEASPSGTTFLKQGAIPQWEGDLFVASLRGTRLWRIHFSPNGDVLEKEPLLQGKFGRLRNVAQAPDGSLWIITSNQDGRGNPTADDDRLIRLGPA